jgi:anti-anti-sigma regulatory factor
LALEISRMHGPCVGIRVRGEIDRDSVGTLSYQVLDLLPCLPIVIDASGIEAIDASCLRMLLAVAELSDGEPLIVIRNPSPPVRRLLRTAIPDGFPGLWVEFDGAGPGAAHRFSELLRSTTDLRRAVNASCERSVSACREARGARDQHVLVKRQLAIA